MNGTKPEGGRWNYDSQNRKQPHKELKIPQTYKAKPDKITEEVIDLVVETFSDHLEVCQDTFVTSIVYLFRVN